ncbi:hypothetical protein LIER_22798 [Lithospermum erythrorhizon]|uniref:Helitron helicase-like domain-containing protein n=1 Tax=Lithospermum erythrorhizon TaxID=34254 RepID=A0AAV3QV45_LITER
MALVQEFGQPDLFVTMTYNPNWLEIKEHLQPGEEAHNRPDLLARVFKAKLSILHEKIMSRMEPNLPNRADISTRVQSVLGGGEDRAIPSSIANPPKKTMKPF